MNTSNPAVKRSLADYRELSLNKSSRYYAQPLENNVLEWHFTIRGPKETDFEGGVYHGRIILPTEYPFKPPHIMFLTPNGRFDVGVKICLSISAYHPEEWKPAWGVRAILEALISFMPTNGEGAIGAVEWSSDDRKHAARESENFACPTCGKIIELLTTPESIKEETQCLDLPRLLLTKSSVSDEDTSVPVQAIQASHSIHASSQPTSIAAPPPQPAEMKQEVKEEAEEEKAEAVHPPIVPIEVKPKVDSMDAILANVQIVILVLLAGLVIAEFV